MNLRPYIITFFCILYTLGSFQGCGVDPLETSEQFGQTICEKKGLLDTDRDGLSDECERLIGSDPNKDDTNNDGIGDKKDPPPPPPPPPGDQNDAQKYDCSDTTYSNKIEQYYCELNGVKRENVKEEARSAQLADSALNAKAPDGTVVQINEQRIHIVNQGKGIGTPTVQSGSFCDNFVITNFCKGEEGQALTSFIFYCASGTVKYCKASSDPNAVQNCEGTPEQTSIALCGPLENPSIANPSSGQNIVIENFKWTSGATLKGLFKPRSMVKNEIVKADLTLTPSDLQNVGSGVFRKLKLKFSRTFDVEGRVERTFTTIDGTQMSDIQYMETTGNKDTIRNFKRSQLDGTIDTSYASQFPMMLGKFRADTP